MAKFCKDNLVKMGKKKKDNLGNVMLATYLYNLNMKNKLHSF